MLVNILTAAHVIVSVLLIGLVLIQRGEGGMGSLGGGGSEALMSGNSAGNALTRTTKWLFIIFLALSLALAHILSGAGGRTSVVDMHPAASTPVAPIPTEVPASPTGAPVAPAAPVQPAAK